MQQKAISERVGTVSDATPLKRGAMREPLQRRAEEQFSGPSDRLFSGEA
jgi:hypothetical protein